MIYSSPYLHDYGALYKYGDKYKLVCLASYRQPGFEPEYESFVAKGDAGNEEKLANSLSRSKANIFELAYCNLWEYFVTLTLDKEKYNRHDLSKFVTDLGQFIRDLRKKYGTDFKYLLVPEQHKDGAWHLHGFFMGIPEEELREFTLQDYLPTRIRARIAEGKRVFTWAGYERKFGFANIERLENREAASNYMYKYVTKDSLHTVSELNAHIYYASKNLNRRERIKSGFVNHFTPDYSNEYCAEKWFDSPEEALRYFEDGEVS